MKRTKDVRRRHLTIWGVSFLSVLLLSGCASKVERNIKKLEGSQEKREQAIMELVLAKQAAVPSLIEALQDANKPSRARVNVAKVLSRIYMSMIVAPDPRILPALLGSIDDEDPNLRSAVVMALNDIGEKESIAPLFGRLDDPEEIVVHHALSALGRLADQMEEWEQDSLVQKASILAKSASDTKNGRKVRQQAEELLEAAAEKIVQEAERLALKADLQGAETEFLKAKKLVPNSLNVNLKLGKFYFHNGEEQRGLNILRKSNLAVYAKRLYSLPQIDGDLGDACWKEATVIDTLYQRLDGIFHPPLATGKSRIFLGYTDESFYVALKAYKNRKDIVANHTARDSNVWMDDCLEVFMDTNHDYMTLVQICVNSLGEYFDMRIEDGGRWTSDYNGVFTTRAKVEDDFWSVELEIPYKELETSPPKKGTIWGFNLISTRMAKEDSDQWSEQAQWAPTYARAHTPSRFGFLIFN